MHACMHAYCQYKAGQIASTGGNLQKKNPVVVFLQTQFVRVEMADTIFSPSSQYSNGREKQECFSMQLSHSELINESVGITGVI